jgi:hypothetical protein
MSKEINVTSALTNIAVNPTQSLQQLQIFSKAKLFLKERTKEEVKNAQKIAKKEMEQWKVFNFF